MTDHAIRVVAAGWYDDPADPSSVRWWNGVGWTEHTSLKPEARAALDAAPAPVTVTAPAPAPVTAPEPARSQTGIVWLIALIPVIAFVLALAAFYVYFYVATSPLVALVALVPYLLGLLWAVSDRRRLAARGFAPPSALWALLTPLGYLIVRRLRVPGTGPVLLFAITAVLTVAVPAVILVSGAGRMVTIAAHVQHDAQTQLVDSGRLTSVTCPPVIESLAPGSLFTCQATATDGTPTQVWVSIDSADGRFSIAPAV